MLNGILTVNKIKDFSSHDIIYKIRKKLKENNINIKVGHTGTLDPFAEGVLVITLGDATKLTQELQSQIKSYIATVQLGIKTDTDDITGNIIQTMNIDPHIFDKLSSVIDTYKGVIKQTPPIYSAISVNGKRLYKYARQKKEIVIPEREITIYDINLIDTNMSSFTIKVRCSSGTYIRSLARDIAFSLGNCGTLFSLTRIEVGNYRIENSLDVSEVLNMDILDIKKLIISLENLFASNRFEISHLEYQKIQNGNISFLMGRKEASLFYQDKVKAIVNNSKIKYLFLNNM